MQTEKLTNAQYYRDSLIDEMTQHTGHMLASNVQDAFSFVSRDLFVDSFFEQQGHTLTWKRVVNPSLDAIYQDKALVTGIDESGFPDSSSSQPSIMALQLESLDLRPGQRVLEIGTGTGYNAALMSRMVRPDGQVVSVDINEELVNKAQLRLQQPDYANAVAISGDGWGGELAYAPYDRILATCSVRTIPCSWLQQTRLGGVIIANVLFKLASVFVRLERVDTNAFQGRFLPVEGVYMEMRQPHATTKSSRRRGTNWSKYDALPHYDIPVSDGNGTILFNNPAYCLMLQAISTGVSKHYRWIDADTPMAYYLMNDTEPDAAVHFQDTCLTVYGDAPRLIATIRESIAFYQEQGCPDVTQYELRIVDEQATLTVNQHNFPLPLIAMPPS